jgi:carboxymethylenebutenolidase
MTEKAVDIKTADGVADSHVFHPDGPGACPAVIFFMDGLGIRPEMHAMARRLAVAGYYVVQPNLFYRAGRSPLLDAAKVFTDKAEMGKLLALIQQLTPDVVVRDAGAWQQFLNQQPQVKGGKVGAVGYCMGGAMVLRMAAQYPDHIVAGASFHGGRLGADAPDSPHHLAPKIRAKLHIGLAETDDWMTPEMVDRLTAAFDKAGVDYQAEVYPGTRHGWGWRTRRSISGKAPNTIGTACWLSSTRLCRRGEGLPIRIDT